jgi:putative (di)nucleoside polyphosphate hydrolase
MLKEHPKLQEDQISGYFRANVGVVIINRDGLVRAGKRCDVPGDEWQLPQGGITQGEEEEQAALREIREELGLNEQDTGDLLQPLGTHDGWFAYELPKINWSTKNGRGQTQKYFAYRFIGQDDRLETRFEQLRGRYEEEKKELELCAWKWTSMSDLTNKAVAFRRPVYEAVRQAFSNFLAS